MHASGLGAGRIPPDATALADAATKSARGIMHCANFHLKMKNFTRQI